MNAQVLSQRIYFRVNRTHLVIRHKALECIDGNCLLTEEQNVAYEVAQVLFGFVVRQNSAPFKIEYQVAARAQFLQRHVDRKNRVQVAELAHLQASTVSERL